MTIHITPEPEFSYVSFESNVASSNYGDLIARVIETFQPGKFVVTIFANKVCELTNRHYFQRKLNFFFSFFFHFRHLHRSMRHAIWIMHRQYAIGNVETSNTVALNRMI